MHASSEAIQEIPDKSRNEAILALLEFAPVGDRRTAMRFHKPSYQSLLCVFWGMATLMGMGAANACPDYVCAPNDPFRHTVTRGNFTNLYLYPNPSAMSWDQYTSQSLKQVPGKYEMTVAAIDGLVQALTGSSYFYLLSQYHEIEPPRFSGHQNTVQQCVDPVMAYARANGNILSREILADFVGCETSNGGNKSDQVNIILSPEFEAKIDFAFTVPVVNKTVTLSSQSPACATPKGGEGAFHSGQLTNRSLI